MNQSQFKPLLIASNERGFGIHSGYPIITKYFPDCKYISVERRSSKTLDQRLLNKFIKTFAVSNWYQTSSADLEWLTWKQISKNHKEPIHYLWGERDLGYLDLFLDLASQPVYLTSHACSDDLPKIFHHGNRLKALSGLIILSESQRSFFRDCGLKDDKIHFIPHGIDTEFFHPLDSSKEANQQFIVLSVGNYRRKFSHLREVFSKLLSFSNIRIKVVSSTKNFEYFSDLSNVEFLSNLSDIELLNIYQMASCQVISVENATANNALLEGLACGLPVVAEKVAGITEYANENCAIFTDIDDVQGMANGIIELSQSKLHHAQMAQSARQRALELSWPNISDQLWQLYSSLA